MKTSALGHEKRSRGHVSAASWPSSAQVKCGCQHPSDRASCGRIVSAIGQVQRQLKLRTTAVACRADAAAAQCCSRGRHFSTRKWSPPQKEPRLWRPARQGGKPQTRAHSNLQEEVLLPLGLDFLTFLAATVLVIPIFKSVKASPVLGFLFSGLVLGQLG